MISYLPIAWFPRGTSWTYGLGAIPVSFMWWPVVNGQTWHCQRRQKPGGTGTMFLVDRYPAGMCVKCLFLEACFVGRFCWEKHPSPELTKYGQLIHSREWTLEIVTTIVTHAKRGKLIQMFRYESLSWYTYYVQSPCGFGSLEASSEIMFQATPQGFFKRFVLAIAHFFCFWPKARYRSVLHFKQVVCFWFRWFICWLRCLYVSLHFNKNLKLA